MRAGMGATDAVRALHPHGPVYTFWDTGRGAWNYIGEGINGGNRVLGVIGKDQDDVVFVSAEVRQELIESVSRNSAWNRRN